MHRRGARRGSDPGTARHVHALGGGLPHARRPLRRMGLRGVLRPRGRTSLLRGGLAGGGRRGLRRRGPVDPLPLCVPCRGDPLLGHAHDRLGRGFPGRLLLTVRPGREREHDPCGAQRELHRIDPLLEGLVPGADRVLDPLLHAAVDAPGVAVVGQDAEMGEQAGEVVGAATRADGVDVEQAHDPAVLDEHLRLVEVAVDDVVRSHVDPLLDRGQALADLPHQSVQARPESGHGGGDDPRVELDRVGPRRPQRQAVHGGGQAVQQRDQVLGAAGVHALVDHRAGERPARQLREHDEALMVRDDLGHRHPGGEQALMALHDLAAAVRLHDLEIHGRGALGGAQHGAPAGTVGDDVDRDRLGRVRTEGDAQVMQGAADDVGIADLREHRQPRIMGVAPHTDVDVPVGHHQGLLGDVEVLLALPDMGARAEQLLPGRGLGAVQLGPGDLGAVQGLGAAAGAVVDVVELPAVQHPARVADGRAEQPTGSGPGEQLGAVLRV